MNNPGWLRFWREICDSGWADSGCRSGNLFCEGRKNSLDENQCSLFRFYPKAFHFSPNWNPIHIHGFGGLGFVPTVLIQNPNDVVSLLLFKGRNGRWQTAVGFNGEVSNILRQIITMDFRSVGQGCGSFDDVLKLSDIAGPTVLAKQLHGIAIDGLNVFADVFALLG